MSTAEEPARDAPAAGASAPEAPEGDLHPRLERPSVGGVLRGLLGLLAAIGLIAWLMPVIAGVSWSEIVQPFRHIGVVQILALLAAMLGGLWSYTWLMTGSCPGLEHRQALIVNVAGTGVSNILPGGGAAGAGATYLMLRSWGHTRTAASSSLITTWLWNVVSRVLLPLVGLAVLAVAGIGAPAGVVAGAVAGTTVAVVLVAFFAALLSAPQAAIRVAEAVLRLVGHGIRPAARVVESGRVRRTLLTWSEQTRGVVRTGGADMTLGTIGYLAMYFVLFWGCAHVVGLELGTVQLFGAYCVGRALSQVGVTPGGLGVTEAGTAAVLTAFGADGVAASATTLLFTLYTHFAQIPLGAVGWLAWWLGPRQR